MNWLAQPPVRGWMKSHRPTGRSNCIASRFLAGASRKNSSPPPSSRLYCGKLGTAARRPSRPTSIFSGRTSAACRRPTRKAISSWPANFCSRRCRFRPARFTGFTAKILLKPPPNLPKKNYATLCRRTKTGQPVLDLIFLGMGEDGHVASLFPNAQPTVLNCADPFLAVGNSPKPPPKRISLSYAAIAAAKQVWVLVSGAGKETAFRESLKPDGQTPLARVMRSRFQTKIFSDIQAG